MRKSFANFEFDGELQLVDQEGQGFNGPVDQTNGEKENYIGLDRRREHRREGKDRRMEIRFEAGKEDRRSGIDRRKGRWEWMFDI